MFVWTYRHTWKVLRICEVLGISRSGYYLWVKERERRQQGQTTFLLVKIKESYEKSRHTYGSRRIAADLRAEGINIGPNKVARIMRDNGIKAKTKRKYKVTTNSRHSLPIAPNLLKNRPKADKPNKIWVADITYIWTREGWIYLSSILDTFARRIVAWELSPRLTKDFVVSTIKKAYTQRKPAPGLIFHSDRGSQYASYEVRSLLIQEGISQSMSSTGNCYDNATAESFFHTLKTELVYFEQYQSRKEAELSIFDYIETFYNRKRRHSSLDYMSPEQFEINSKVS
jgi:putative transposase